VATLEGLEYHRNGTIAGKANNLLETYYLINADDVSTVWLSLANKTTPLDCQIVVLEANRS